MIQLLELSLLRGPQQLLNNANLTLHSGWKVGIIGANGVGKTSLFKLLLGELHLDGGELKISGNQTIAHMAQEVQAAKRSVLDYVLDGDTALRHVQGQLQTAEAEHQAGRIGELHAQLDNIDGYTAEARAQQLLNGLGFASDDAARDVSDLSGGWRIRLNLAKALMCRSDILLLDEPTNHLDLDATLWLEQWLNNYPGTLLLISHDRDFLDQVVDHIVHMHRAKLDIYKGQYSAFELAKAERLAQQQVQYEKQQQRIAEIEQFVRRFKAKASKAKQAQSRVKELERMETISAAHIDSPFTFSFQCNEKVSNPLLSLRKADCGYPDSCILKQVSIVLAPGSRIALLGPNGAGKSTLIKTLVGDLERLSGERSTGEHLRVGYFSQHQLEALDLEASPLVHIMRLSPTATDQQVRNFLGSFGFFGDDAFAPVKQFSGGEKARVALALIAWQKPNLLLLDEPTNHLDLEVRYALTMAMQEFEGAVILVSHDRHLLRNTVDEFLLVANGEVREFSGDLSDYQNWLTEQRRNLSPTKMVGRENRSQSADEKKEQKRLAAERRTKLRPLKNSIGNLEKQIDIYQQQLSDLEDSLADADMYTAENKKQLKILLSDQASSKAKLDEAETLWMEKLEELEELEASIH
ncbi:MAG: ATP-binding cassette domain-containing protein [Pseudomonadales bacterium]|nr:ATP-binding cassette domain-containing protein [Pseudomonadales bacterium]NRA17450.1 ATP-binding cassette domain-containing protein [Oceanospirillaceae bacterium]